MPVLALPDRLAAGSLLSQVVFIRLRLVVQQAEQQLTAVMAATDFKLYLTYFNFMVEQGEARVAVVLLLLAGSVVPVVMAAVVVAEAARIQVVLQVQVAAAAMACVL
jgi:uncharacterized membrane protein YciS (DUF1049 family)